MWRWLGCAALVLSASCAVAPEENAPVGVLEQPVVLPIPIGSGAADAAVGFSLAVCPGNVVYAGAPGVAALWTFGGGLTPSYAAALPGVTGRLTACDQSTLPMSAGSTGIARFNPGSSAWMLVKPGGEFTVLAPEPSLGVPILAGEANGQLHLCGGSGNDLFAVSAGPRISAGLWLTPDLFVVSDSVQRRVMFYSWTSLSNTATQLSVLQGPASASSFGRALAMGDVTPANTGAELVVGADGRVLIYSLDGGALINTIIGTSGFGAALAIEPDALLGNPSGKVDALWVGQPFADLAWRFIGDAGTSYSPTSPPQQFGWSIAVDKQTPPHVFVGAPDFSDSFLREGVVYAMPLRGAPQTGLLGACSGPASCGACQVCLGGVACVANTNCDGGVADAGLPDSGTPSTNDAGTPDAGSDAGTADAGASTDAGVPTDAGLAADSGVETSDAGASTDAGSTKDAGAVMDAGAATDAGTSMDAGLTTSDAGAFDSGVMLADAGSMPDAGNDPGDLTFAPRCGCSAFGALPSLLLGLLFTRRWRRQTIPARA